MRRNAPARPLTPRSDHEERIVSELPEEALGLALVVAEPVAEPIAAPVVTVPVAGRVESTGSAVYVAERPVTFLQTLGIELTLPLTKLTAAH